MSLYECIITYSDHLKQLFLSFNTLNSLENYMWLVHVLEIQLLF